MALAAVPLANGWLRLTLVVGVLLLWASAVWLVWERRKARWSLIGLAIATTLVCALPGRSTDPARLRASYLESLSSYEGTDYVWGGENGLGIDCSGLVRRAMVDAHLEAAVMTVDGAELRRAGSLWWHDASARALGDGYRDETRHVTSARSINLLDHASIEPGDLAVTTDGLHVLAYVGDATWIDADPNAGEVVRVTAPNGSDPWLQTPVNIVRWRALEPGGQP